MDASLPPTTFRCVKFWLNQNWLIIYRRVSFLSSSGRVPSSAGVVRTDSYLWSCPGVTRSLRQVEINRRTRSTQRTFSSNDNELSSGATADKKRYSQSHQGESGYYVYIRRRIRHDGRLRHRLHVVRVYNEAIPFRLSFRRLSLSLNL